MINRLLGWNEDNKVTGANLHLEDIVKTLTGGVLTKWPIKGQLPSAKLSVKYAVMHKMSLSNLMPTSNNTNVSEAVGKMLYVLGSEQNLDFGQVIFDQIVDHAKTGARLKPIGFPRLICSIVLRQHPNILKAEDGQGEPMKEFTISDKLLKSDHVLDVEIHPTDNPPVKPRGEVAAEMAKIIKNELQVLETEILNKQRRVSELKRKLAALELTDDPTVNDPEVQQSDAGKGKSVVGGATDIAERSKTAHGEDASDKDTAADETVAGNEVVCDEAGAVMPETNLSQGE